MYTFLSLLFLFKCFFLIFKVGTLWVFFGWNVLIMQHLHASFLCTGRFVHSLDLFYTAEQERVIREAQIDIAREKALDTYEREIHSNPCSPRNHEWEFKMLCGKELCRQLHYYDIWVQEGHYFNQMGRWRGWMLVYLPECIHIIDTHFTESVKFFRGGRIVLRRKSWLTKRKEDFYQYILCRKRKGFAWKRNQRVM